MNKEKQINWSSVYHQVPQWFADAKFGIFLHWGPYSVPAFKDEWYSRNMYAKGLPHNIYHEKTYGNLKDFGYKDFYPLMTGSRFDPDEWADLVVRSGAKYAGPVSEHSDNFSLWNSQVNPVNSVNYGPHRDIVGECFEAFRKKGIKTLATFHHQWLWGWFMSTDNEADVYDPANELYYGPALPLETNRYQPYRLPDEKFCNIWRRKVDEVIDNYDPDVVYFDSRTFIIDENERFKMVQHYYQHTGPNRGIITYKQEDFPEGIGIYDVERGAFSESTPVPWQTDDRLEDNITWCMVQDPKYRSATSVIQQLCDIVSKNGNLLLNVGPYADGSIHPEAVRQLHAIGDWLKINGEAIYGTRPYRVAGEGPTETGNDNYDISKIESQLKHGVEEKVDAKALSPLDFRFTTKDNSLYAIAMGWPEQGFWKIRALKDDPRQIKDVSMPGIDTPLSFERNTETLTVKAPAHRPCEHAYVLKITFF